jgi:hypothetical protein
MTGAHRRRPSPLYRPSGGRKLNAVCWIPQEVVSEISFHFEKPLEEAEAGPEP